jgi:hypothetical protein
MPKVSILQGEAKTLPFLIRSRLTGQPMPGLATATYLLWAKTNQSDLTPLFTKVDADFDKSLAAVGKISTPLTAYETMRDADWAYQCELKITMASGMIYKIPFELEVLSSDSPNDWSVSPQGMSSLEAFGTPVVSSI